MEFVGPSAPGCVGGWCAYKDLDLCNRSGFRARYYASEFEARTGTLPRKTAFKLAQVEKAGGDFSKEAIIDSCGPSDRDGCKKRIETSATFQQCDRHAENPIGTRTFPLFLYLTLSLAVLLLAAFALSA